MLIRGLNEPELLDDSHILKAEIISGQFRIIDVRTPDFQAVPCVDIVFQVHAGDLEGCRKVERYFLSRPEKVEDGTLKRGSIWKFRKLIIAAGYFDERKDDMGHTVRMVPDPFDTDQLINKVIIADARFEERSGEKWLRISNERFPADLKIALDSTHLNAAIPDNAFDPPFDPEVGFALDVSGDKMPF